MFFFSFKENCNVALFHCHSPSSGEKCNINMPSHLRQKWQWEERSWMIHLRRPESGFLSVQLIKIPGTKKAGCDVRRAGGVGLICMSGQLLHLQIGSHWACLSTPSAALLAYGAIEGIHEHSRGAGLSTYWYKFLFLWHLRSIGELLVPSGGFSLYKIAEMKWFFFFSIFHWFYTNRRTHERE